MTTTPNFQQNTDDDEDDQPLSIDDIRVIVKEIKDFWHLGDNDILSDARHVLLEVLHRAAKRMHDKYPKS